MSNENEVLSISREQYERIYLEQRQRLHVNLVQQLIAKSEARKQLVLTKSTEIIENFVQYRDEFLRNMPSELKSMKVSEYLTKGTENLQESIKKNNETALSNFYKLFQQEFDKANKGLQKANSPITREPVKFQPEKKVIIANKENIKPLELPETDDTVLELISNINDNVHVKPKKVETTPSKQLAAKSKGKIENSVVKNSKKRKWDNYTSSSKETKPNLNYSTSKQKDLKVDTNRIILSEKKKSSIICYFNKSLCFS